MFFIAFLFGGRERDSGFSDFVVVLFCLVSLRTKRFEDSPFRPCVPLNAFSLIFHYTWAFGFVFSDFGWSWYFWQWL